MAGMTADERTLAWALSVGVPDGVYRAQTLGAVVADRELSRLRHYASRRRGELAAAALVVAEQLGQVVDLPLDHELALRAIAKAASAR